MDFDVLQIGNQMCRKTLMPLAKMIQFYFRDRQKLSNNPWTFFPMWFFTFHFFFVSLYARWCIVVSTYSGRPKSIFYRNTEPNRTDTDASNKSGTFGVYIYIYLLFSLNIDRILSRVGKNGYIEKKILKISKISSLLPKFSATFIKNMIYLVF